MVAVRVEHTAYILCVRQRLPAQEVEQTLQRTRRAGRILLKLAYQLWRVRRAVCERHEQRRRDGIVLRVRKLVCCHRVRIHGHRARCGSHVLLATIACTVCGGVVRAFRRRIRRGQRRAQRSFTGCLLGEPCGAGGRRLRGAGGGVTRS